MAEPLTWRAVQEVKTLLQSIDGSSGWHTDIGTHPIHDDRTVQPDTSAPFTVIVADEITTAETATGRSRRTLSGDQELVIECAVPAGDANAELVAHRARADIVRALCADLRGAAPGFRTLTIVSTRITDAVLAGTELVIAQVLVRASLTESQLPA
jgi:hypothetical protein